MYPPDQDMLISDYQTILASLGDNPSDDAIVAALIQEADWTQEGAREVLRLSRAYGSSILRNALALASAMEIEDGYAGM